ncbi:MAG: hypothetical protein SWX82_09065 [Cyanobacteriota bacterium]|nr:hypothetical protein [Cyanobacteriota bacterium]
MYLNKAIATKPNIPIVLVTDSVDIEAIALSSIETHLSYVVLLRYTQ